MTSLKDDSAFELPIRIRLRKLGVLLHIRVSSFALGDGFIGHITPLSDGRIIPASLSDKLIPFFIEGSFGLGIRSTLLSIHRPGNAGTVKETDVSGARCSKDSDRTGITGALSTTGPEESMVPGAAGSHIWLIDIELELNRSQD